ncbi:hypothetical protein SAMN04488542_10585 [Fontibacillus panacisegetis]|uniref:Uncharacterized protein n=1 Tax=Fontibacillus panacisegetis TaxID=670482 RepID=A0A1G7HY77_9BACL|nr:hypothetical protein [Fontibacillus panacisegetis]SDF05497.1 hypothetical protein SAMN04488542_10585 [Fontibacillus panacisegetis]
MKNKKNQIQKYIEELKMKEEYIEYLSDDQTIIHRKDGGILIINGSPSVDNCKTFVKILLLEKQRLYLYQNNST